MVIMIGSNRLYIHPIEGIGALFYLNGMRVTSYEDLQKKTGLSNGEIFHLKLKLGSMSLKRKSWISVEEQ